MKGLLFLARVALICNVLFAACVIFRFIPDIRMPQAVIGTMVVLGLVLSPFINLAANISYLITRLRKKTSLIPAWLVVTNFLFLLAQILIDLILV